MLFFEMGFEKKGGTLKMRDGGAFRGCGAQVKGKKFKEYSSG